MSCRCKPKRFVSFVILFSTILSPVLVQASISLHNSELNVNRIKTVNIDNFKGFSLTLDTFNINSTQDSDKISFQASYDNSGLYEYEIYTFSFDKIHGECIEFSLELNIDYNYYGNQLGHFVFQVGGYQSELGLEYESLNYLEVKISDIWISQSGVYGITAWPYLIEAESLSDYGGISTSGSKQFLISKIDNELVCKVKSGYNTLMTKTWSKGVSRPVNYFKIYSKIIAHSITEVDVDFSSISGYIKTDTSTAVAGAGNTWWITLLVILAVGFIGSLPFIIRRFSIKQRLLKGDKENFEPSYSWSLDDD